MIIEENLIQEYKDNKISLTEIAKLKNTSRFKITRYFKLRNIKINSNFRNKKHSFNESFFEKIDSEYKAYWLGFIAADGHVADYQIQITLNDKDSSHLFLFLKNIDSLTHNVKSYYSKTSYGIIKCSSITLSSKKMSNDLRKLGLESNKSKTLKFPDLEINMIPHFIRGYFDGDGSISLSGGRHSKPYVIFLGNNDMMNNIKNNLNVSDCISILTRYDKNDMYHFRIGKKEDVKYMYNYFYKESNIYLKRKKEKFEKLLRASETTIAQPTL